MKTSVKVLLVTLACAVFAFMLGGNAPLGAAIWPPADDNPEPTSTQLPLLMVLGAVSSLAFGLGVSFLVFGWPLVRQVAGAAKTLAVLMYVSIAWLLVNWVPHENLHIANGMDLSGLIAIEYGFHVTLIAAGAIVAFGFARMLMMAGGAMKAAA